MDKDTEMQVDESVVAHNLNEILIAGIILGALRGSDNFMDMFYAESIGYPDEGASNRLLLKQQFGSSSKGLKQFVLIVKQVN